VVVKKAYNSYWHGSLLLGTLPTSITVSDATQQIVRVLVRGESEKLRSWQDACQIIASPCGSCRTGITIAN
jgi:hypothetical protein